MAIKSIPEQGIPDPINLEINYYSNNESEEYSECIKKSSFYRLLAFWLKSNVKKSSF